MNWFSRLRNIRILAPLPQVAVRERYLVALICAVLAVISRIAMDPLLGHSGAFYVTVYMAVLVAALLGGLGPGTLSAGASLAAIIFLILDPRNSFLIANADDRQELLGSLMVCAVLVGLGTANRTKRLQLDASHLELEQRVAERTAELTSALTNLESEVRVRQQAEKGLRQLSINLMTVQDEERRRIARDLHDSAGQTLAAMKMTLATLNLMNKQQRPETEKLMNDLGALMDAALQEIRTASYLLHPPLLEEAGFASAARWFVEGFSKRSGIQVSFDTDIDGERLPRNVELVLFRVLQESLTNVHRHSGASSAEIHFAKQPGAMRLEIRDNGRGLPPERLRNFQERQAPSGVGLAGMRERMGELGGRLEIASSAEGTQVTAVLPERAIMAQAGN
jgi:signal transduction histidine kinase